MAVVHISTRPLWTQYIRGIGVPGIKAHAVNQIIPEPAGVEDGYRTVCGTVSHHHDLHAEPPDDLQGACKLCHRAMRARFGADARWFRSTVARLEPADPAPTFEEAVAQIELNFTPGATGTGPGSPRRTVPATATA